ncbi:snake venom serine protease HS112-like [Symphorus nematophorus]
MGGITRLLPLLLAGVTVSTVVDLHKRIIGGQECDNNERHHHVKWKFPNGDICGGTLISKSWILTAEHCKDSTITAYLGLHPRPEKDIPPVEITERVTFGAGHDIMLLKLPKAFKDVEPAPLPECNNCPTTGKKVQIAGYGPTGDNQPQAAVL